jgi:uncharacterized membrane protein
VEPWVIAVVAVSAVLHVAWNVRLKTSGDPLRTATVMTLAGLPGIVPLALFAWGRSGWPALPPEGIVLGVVSGVIEACYFVLLAAAYKRGDLSVVYPIARGTAPLLAVVVGVTVFGERLGVAGSLGVVALIGGFFVLQRPWRAITARGGPGGVDPAILFALATGVTIATYSTIDRAGTRLVDPFIYAGILWVVQSATLVVWVTVAAGGDIFAGGRASLQRAAVGGVLTLFAYLSILVALSVAPLSGVAPLRESATVFAAAWGSVRLGEAADRGEVSRRVGASVLIVGGALLLAVGS